MSCQGCSGTKVSSTWSANECWSYVCLLILQVNIGARAHGELVIIVLQECCVSFAFERMLVFMASCLQHALSPIKGSIVYSSL